MAKKLFIFDMDGVLLDSEPYHTKAHLALYNQLVPGRPLPFPNVPGRSVEAYYHRMLKEHYGRLPTKDEVEDWRGRHFVALAQLIEQDKLPATEGLYQLLDALEQRGYKMGVASSSDRYYVDAVLVYLGIQNRIPYRACGDEVVHTKPAPDVYQALLARAGAAPQDAFALEDSASGLRAAVAAGISCIGFVPGPGKAPPEFKEACAVVQNLGQVAALL